MNMDGVSANMMMDPGKLIDQAMAGLEKDQLEIYPGLARVMKIMSRLAPGFLIKQANKVGAKFMEG